MLPDEVEDCPRYSPKMVIETLSIAQSPVAAFDLDRHRVDGDLARVKYLINRYELMLADGSD
ncbi:hypothetical protein GBF35_28040 [Nonomuraea phyllanthi]|uniref:hypothetical protein n=1 Tax=Nonomuraea phyllanthi TaxID=2219224 RepID=UPI001292E95B|nr:hypothetical protein [Nonomuraea phyllanthi]QFY09980.1 hypothetical protein GBF35_28040 [Nonomuraea phyllanthi]